MTPTEVPGNNILLWRLIGRGFVGLVIFPALLFDAAGSIHYWQGWVLMGLEFGVAAMFCTYFYKRDPKVLERRLLRKEPMIAQKIIVGTWKFLSATSVVLAGCDHRLGWSRRFFEPVPTRLTVLSFALIAGAHALNFAVLKANRFAASVIQIESGQKVAASGPYRVIRHPMYLAFAIIGVFAPLALGSFVAVPVASLVIPIIVCRLLNEEKLLRRDLPSYSDYCQQTRYRLLPYVW